MKLKVLLRLILMMELLAAGCAPQPTAPTQFPAATAALPTPPPMNTSAPVEAIDLNVFAAASLTNAFEEIGQHFEAQHPGVTVVFNFAGSQQLAQQINEGAPADVFASANRTQMEIVIKAGGVVSDTQKTFVRNRLVVVFPQDNQAKLTTLQDLTKPGLKLVFAAKEVPVGQYSFDLLDKAIADPAFGATYKDDVLKNVVSYEDNVKAVLTKVALGEADAGIVYTSDVSGADAGKVGQLDIPDALNVIASYPIAPIQTSKQAELAQAFVDWVLSPDGQALLAKHNFIPVVK